MKRRAELKETLNSYSKLGQGQCQSQGQGQLQVKRRLLTRMTRVESTELPDDSNDFEKEVEKGCVNCETNTRGLSSQDRSFSTGFHDLDPLFDDLDLQCHYQDDNLENDLSMKIDKESENEEEDSFWAELTVFYKSDIDHVLSLGVKIITTLVRITWQKYIVEPSIDTKP